MSASSSAGACRKLARAFTIIELLVVMAVIIILAGLVLATAGYVQKKGARSRAEAEIAALSAACESYKADNGIYPYEPATNTLTAADTNSDNYKAASLILYRAISGDNDNDSNRSAENRSYFQFRPNQLSPTITSSAAKVDFIRDPFGNSYGYSTSKNPAANANASTAAGYNPTFDLWSSASSTDASQWIKNW